MINTVYKSVEFENRKQLNLNNDLIIVISNDQVNNLKPLSLYQWHNHLNVNIRQFNKNQFGDLIFSNINEAIKDKDFTLKELEYNKKSVKEFYIDKIKYNRLVRMIKNRIISNNMESKVITNKVLTDLIKRYDIKLTLNQLKNIGLLDTVYYKDSEICSIGINKKSRMRVETILKIMDTIKDQLK